MGDRRSRIRDAIAKIVPGLEQIGEIDQTKQEFAIPGRTFHTPTFPHRRRQGAMLVHELPTLAAALRSRNRRPAPVAPTARSLRLMTIRSEGQFNTVVYEDYDLYRGVERRDVILMHPDDIAALGLTDGQRSRVTSDAGEMTGISVHAFPDIRAGNAAMYYPEANVLVPRAIDPLSQDAGVQVRARRRLADARASQNAD